MPLSSTLSSIVLQLRPLTDCGSTGGYPVDSYNVQYKDTSTWNEVQGQDGSLSLAIQVTIGSLTGGNTYTVRVRAHNINGWGAWSSSLIVVASGIPEKPDPVQVHLVNLDVQISWTPPTNNFASITAYQILILHSDGTTFTENLQFCDGSKASIVS
jgi:hypothetical protein